MIIESAKDHKPEVIKLLTSVNLPADDLPETLDNFVGFFEGGLMTGVAGMEQYGDYALLRSVAVSADHRGKGIAGQLLKAVEELAFKKEVAAIYLLTETATAYFSRKGYQTIARGEVPEAIKQSSEFSHVCPVSAIVMKKNLN